MLSSSEEEVLLKERIESISENSFAPEYKKAAIRLIAAYGFTDMVPRLFDLMSSEPDQDINDKIREEIFYLVKNEIKSKGQSSILKNALDYIESNNRKAPGVQNRVSLLRYIFSKLARESKGNEITGIELPPMLRHEIGFINSFYQKNGRNPQSLYAKVKGEADRFKAYEKKNEPKYKGHVIKGVF